MIFNNAFLKYDQYGFQQILFVGVSYIFIIRSTNSHTSSAFRPRCTLPSLPAVSSKTRLKAITLTTFWTRQQLEEKSRHIITAPPKGYYYRTRMGHWLGRILNARSSATSLWLPQEKNILLLAGWLWQYLKVPDGIPLLTTPWLSLQHGAGMEDARFSILTTAIVPNSVKVRALVANLIWLLWAGVSPMPSLVPVWQLSTSPTPFALMKISNWGTSTPNSTPWSAEATPQGVSRQTSEPSAEQRMLLTTVAIFQCARQAADSFLFWSDRRFLYAGCLARSWMHLLV